MVVEGCTAILAETQNNKKLIIYCEEQVLFTNRMHFQRTENHFIKGSVNVAAGSNPFLYLFHICKPDYRYGKTLKKGLLKNNH